MISVFRKGSARALADYVLGSGAGSLRSRVIQGGGVILLGDLYSNLVRLGANLVMTRLLYPEAFGLMVIVNLVFSGLSMLSDLGIRGAMIVRKEEIDSDYLHTAWTMGVLRGISLALLSLVLAYPVSQFYGESLLFWLIAIQSLIPILQGLTSPYPILYEKKIRFGRIFVWNALAQTVSVMIVLTWLLIYPTIWALAAHGILVAAIAAFSSYYIFPAKAMRLAWDKPSAWQIFRIGRWMFVASGLTFLARQGDSLIISKWVTAEQLGVFGIALTLAKLVEMIVERISWSLLFPVYAEIQSGDGQRFGQQLRKVKLVLFGLCTPIVLVFSLFGRDLINLLYDPRYHGAGWMLEIMAAGSVFFAAGAAILNIPMSFGDSYRHMWLQFVRFVLMLSVMTIGGIQAGLFGLVIGISVSQALFYPVLRVFTHRYGIRDYVPDVIFLISIMTIIFMVWYLRGWPV